MARTYTQQLDDVQAAILAIESGAQSYTIAGRSMTRGNLDALYKREERLITKVARETTGGGIRVRGGTPVG